MIDDRAAPRCSAGTNSFELIFTPAALGKHKYELTLEISANGRGEKRFVPVTLINGAC